MKHFKPYDMVIITHPAKQGEVIQVTGEIDFSNAMSAYEKSLEYLSSSHDITFDFSQVKMSSSASLALLIEWLKYAKSHQKNIHFNSLSNNILAIARVAGLEKIIRL